MTQTVSRPRSEQRTTVLRRSGTRRARSHRRSRRGQPIGVLYVLPALALYTAIVVIPFGHGIWISLHAWDGASPMRWVGLHNFVSSLQDGAVRSAFLHSLVIVVFYAAIPVGLGLALAAILARTKIRGMGLWRAILFMPQAISVVVVGVAWQWLLQDDGPANQLLRAIGLGSLTRVWLGDFTWALPTEGLIGTWLMSGLCMVLFLSGVQAIDTELYDAANVDGAGPIREFFAVTLPGLRKVIAVASVLTLVVALNNFGLIWVTTQGGPGNETQVMSTIVYERAFLLGDIGGASAIAVLLALVIIVVSFGIAKLGDSE
jgi:raffinose/stachyose/melibiose transport system permease protein